MATMQVSLPDQMKAWVQQAGGASDRRTMRTQAV